MSPSFKRLQAFVLIAFTLFFSSCEFKSSGYHINATIKNLAPGSKITLEELGHDAIIPLDSTHADKDSRFELKGFLKQEGLYRINLGTNKFILLVLNEKKQSIDIKGDTISFIKKPFSIKGSPLSAQLQDLLLSITNKKSNLLDTYTKMSDSIHPPVDSLKKVYEAAYEKQKNGIRNYLTTYIDTVTDPVIGIFTAYYFMYPEMDMPVFVKLANKLKKSYPDLTMSKAFIDDVEQMQKQMNPTDQPMFTNGKELPEIEMNDVSGNPLKLSSLRGNYVLVDFWASWCGPCRGENPNVVKAYNDFKDKGFTVFSVSLDDDHDKWVKAIAKDKLDWPSHVSELKGWRSDICQKFGITSIPTNYLIDKEGKVIASDLRGNELENILQQTIK